MRAAFSHLYEALNDEVLMPRSQATVTTASASRYLQQLCKHWSHKFAVEFTPELLRKDLDLGLGLGTEMGVPMPVTAAAREVLQQHFGAAQYKPDPQKYLAGDFAALLETMAIGAGVKLKSENKQVPTGLE